MNKSRFIKVLSLLAIFLFNMSNGNAQNKVLGGQDATKNIYPWVAGLSYSDESNLYYGQYCGGSLIDDYWVLTAAHCLTADDEVTPMNPSELNVFFNVYDLTNSSEALILEVDSLFIHPNYNHISSDSDIGLIKLKSPVQADPVLLPKQNEISMLSPGTRSRVIGWGAYTRFESYPTILQQADLEVIDFNICNSQMSYAGMLTSNMICAGFMDGHADACKGDSGGPLIMLMDNSWLQCGVVSWGYDCGTPNVPGVYTLVPNYTNWIELKLGKTISVDLPQGYTGWGDEEHPLSLNEEKNIYNQCYIDASGLHYLGESISSLQVYDLQGRMLMSYNQLDTREFSSSINIQSNTVLIARILFSSGEVESSLLIVK